MIVIRMELWPAGDESRKQELGIGQIANVGGTATSGDYEVKLMKSARYAKSAGVWKRGGVAGFPRHSKEFGPWDLLLLALNAALGPERTIRLLQQTRPVLTAANDGKSADPDKPTLRNIASRVRAMNGQKMSASYEDETLQMIQAYGNKRVTLAYRRGWRAADEHRN